MSQERIWIPFLIGFDKVRIVKSVVMQVLVKLHTNLKDKIPHNSGNPFYLTLPIGADISEVISELQIQYNPEYIMIVLNGRLSDLDSLLNDGDRVDIIPAISGGLY